MFKWRRVDSLPMWKVAPCKVFVLLVYLDGHK